MMTEPQKSKITNPKLKAYLAAAAADNSDENMARVFDEILFRAKFLSLITFDAHDTKGQKAATAGTSPTETTNNLAADASTDTGVQMPPKSQTAPDTPVSAAPAPAEPKPGLPSISFILLNDKEGKQYLPAFTDDEELAKFQQLHLQQIVSVAVFTFDEYAEIILDNKLAQGLVLNPFTENVLLVKEMVEVLRLHKNELTSN